MKFEIGTSVTIVSLDTTGTVIGRDALGATMNRYLVTTDGGSTSNWYDESNLTANA